MGPGPFRAEEEADRGRDCAVQYGPPNVVLFGLFQAFLFVLLRFGGIGFVAGSSKISGSCTGKGTVGRRFCVMFPSSPQRRGGGKDNGAAEKDGNSCDTRCGQWIGTNSDIRQGPGKFKPGRSIDGHSVTGSKHLTQLSAGWMSFMTGAGEENAAWSGLGGTDGSWSTKPTAFKSLRSFQEEDPEAPVSFSTWLTDGCFEQPELSKRILTCSC